MKETELVEILQIIKDKFLSNTNMPKLVVGTGLSISYGIQGMTDLASHLNSAVPKLLKDDENLRTWSEISEKMKTMDLENSLSPIDSNRNKDLVNCIATETSRLLLKTIRDNTIDIFSKISGFSRLIDFLIKSGSTNNKILDIMTPNYDLLIEIIADSLGVQCIDGFEGNIIQQFREGVLDSPKSKYKMDGKYGYIRLFKPHGSLNWIKMDDKTIKVNNIQYLLDNVEKICVVAPGGAKYRVGLEEKYFRIPRERFSRALSEEPMCPLIIYGYGFNDTHFNSLIMGSQSRNLLIISKNISLDILNELKKNEGNVAFYWDATESQNKMLHKSKIHNLNEDLWNLDVLIQKIIA